MMRTLGILACAFLATLVIVVVVIAYDLHCNLRAADSTVQRLDEFVTDATLDYAVKAEQVDHILFAARVTADQAGLLAIEQRAQLARTSADSDKTVKAFRLVIDRAGLFFAHTDDQLNGASLPAITVAAQQSFQKIGDNAVAIGDSARAFTAIVSDPHTAAILANLDSTSGHFNVIAGNSEAMSGDMRLAVHRLAQPPGKWHSLLDATYTGLKFGSLFIP